MDDDIFDWLAGQAIITECLGVLKSGKEATVYRCTGYSPPAAYADSTGAGDDCAPVAGVADALVAGTMAEPHSGAPATGAVSSTTTTYVAVKIYKDIERRSFRDMGGYLDGRLEHTVLKRRDRLHIMSDPGSLQAYWVDTEFGALTELYRRGLPVPRPLARNGRAIAMELVCATDDRYPASGYEAFEGQADPGQAAPRLREFSPDAAQAVALHAELMLAVEGMLAADMIHGDLSAYNVLVRDGHAVIIDLPQVIDARYHSQPLAMLERDMVNIRTFFRRWGMGDEDQSRQLARDLWRRYEDRELYRDIPPAGAVSGGDDVPMWYL